MLESELHGLSYSSGLKQLFWMSHETQSRTALWQLRADSEEETCTYTVSSGHRVCCPYLAYCTNFHSWDA